MGCFIACFGSSKHSKSNKSTTTSSSSSHQNFSKKYAPAQLGKFTEAAEIQESIKPISVTRKLNSYLTASPDQSLFEGPAKCEPAEKDKPTEGVEIQDSIPESEKFTANTTVSQDQDLIRRPEFFEPVRHSVSIEAATIQDCIKLISESIKNEEQEVNSPSKIKVAFELKVEASEKVKPPEIATCTVESEERGTIANEENGIKKGTKEENQNQSQSLSDSCDSSMISYPPMHRYHGCTSSDDEYPEMGLCYADSNAVDNLLIQEESSESLFSLSIESRKQVNRPEVDDDKEVTSPLKARDSSEKEMKSVDSMRQIRRAEFDDKEEVKPTMNMLSPEMEMKSNGVNPNPRDRTQSVRSVLNPIEDISQWKVAKASTTSPLSYDEKENANLEQEHNIPISEEPSFKQLGHSSRQTADIIKRQDDDIAVDTSLSSWLVESERTPVSKDSPCSIGNSSLEKMHSWRSFEDRPILRALSVEELKQLSAPSSPRRSPSRNPDEMPIIGTVGSYWSLTGQAMDSSNSGSSRKGRSGRSRNCSEDKKAADFHATPLRKRFEGALDRGTA